MDSVSTKIPNEAQIEVWLQRVTKEIPGQREKRRALALQALMDLFLNEHLSLDIKKYVLDVLIKASAIHTSAPPLHVKQSIVSALSKCNLADMPDQLHDRLIAGIADALEFRDEDVITSAIQALINWSEIAMENHWEHYVISSLLENYSSYSPKGKNMSARALETYSKGEISDELKIEVVEKLTEELAKEKDTETSQIIIKTLHALAQTRFEDFLLPSANRARINIGKLRSTKHDDADIQALADALSAWCNPEPKELPHAPSHPHNKKPIKKTTLRNLTLFESIVLGLGGLTLTISVVGFLGLGQVIPSTLIPTAVFANMALYVPFLFLLSASMFIHSGFGTSFKRYLITILATTALSVLSARLWQPLYGALGLTSPLLSAAMVSILPALLILTIDMIVRMSLRNTHHSQTSSTKCQIKEHSAPKQAHMFAPSTEKDLACILNEVFPSTSEIEEGLGV